MATTAKKSDVILHGRLTEHISRLKSVETKSCRVLDDFQRARPRQRVKDRILFSFLGDALTSSAIAAHRRDVDRFILFLDDTPAESWVSVIDDLKVHSERKLHLARLVSDTAETFIHRFLASMNSEDGRATILDAWWESDCLVALSPTLKRLRVPADKLPTIGGIRPGPLDEFEIDPCGEFMYWPGLDIHIGWNQFRQMTEPAALLRARQASEQFNQRLGRAIRDLRRGRGLKQTDIAGLDPRTVRRIEHGITRASANALGKLARAHGMDTDAYINEVTSRLTA